MHPGLMIGVAGNRSGYYFPACSVPCRFLDVVPSNRLRSIGGDICAKFVEARFLVGYRIRVATMTDAL